MRKLSAFVVIAAIFIGAIVLWSNGADPVAPLRGAVTDESVEVAEESVELSRVPQDRKSARSESATAPVEQPEEQVEVVASPAVAEPEPESMVPAGECGFRVLFSGADPRGIKVSIQQGSGAFMGGDFLPERSLTRPLRMTSGLGGEVEFRDVAAGHWSIEILEASSRSWRSFVKAEKEDEMTDVILEWGACSVEGMAWADDGAPWSDLGVHISITSKNDETGDKSLWRSWARTDESGKYLLDGFQPGHGWMTAAPYSGMDVSMDYPDTVMSDSFGFKPEERRVVNFGSPQGIVDVYLSLSDASGRRMRDGSLSLVPKKNDAGEAATQPTVRDEIDQDGNVVLRCSPGIYHVMVHGWDRNHGVVAEIEVRAPGAFERALQLKDGHSIHGTVVGTDGEPRTGMTSKIGLALRSEPSPKARVVESTRLRADGSFSFHSIKAGDYYLTTGINDSFRHIAVSLPDTEPVAVDVVLESLQ